MIPATRRSKSAGAYDKAIRMDEHTNEKAEMLSDPSTYPLILILGGALSGCAGFGIWNLSHNPDVRCNPANRNKLFPHDDDQAGSVEDDSHFFHPRNFGIWKGSGMNKFFGDRK